MVICSPHMPSKLFSNHEAKESPIQSKAMTSFFKPIGEHVSNKNPRGEDDDTDQGVTQIESLCLNCKENGTTKLLLTRIPYFRDVIVSSFVCPHCHWKNTDVNTASEIQKKGSKIIFKISELKDLDRTVLKGDNGVAKFPDIDLEIPAQYGKMTTIEGLLSATIQDLSEAQPQRKDAQPEMYDKIEAFIGKVQKLLKGELFPCELILDDCTGNSFLEYLPGDPISKWNLISYERSAEENARLGISEQKEADPTEADVGPEEVLQFHGTCPQCQAASDTRMKMIDIPYFKEVIIMATTCSSCNYKSNEVKTGGVIPEKGRKISLQCTTFPEDLNRDILKSTSCVVCVPEIGLELTTGTLGGRFTTIEGLLTNVYDDLYNRVFKEQSDSLAPDSKNNWKQFLEKIQAAKNGEMPFTLILDDPLAQSYIQNLFAPDADPNMKIEEYERSEEQNEDFGLNDISS